MKRSASDRYSSYERVCRNMAFDLGFEIYEDDGVVYEITDSGSVIICMATNVKSVWFETWLVMR